jgi:hypothetical protein
MGAFLIMMVILLPYYKKESIDYVSLRQICMKSFFALAKLIFEFNPMRSTTDEKGRQGRANDGARREPGAGRAAFCTLA